MDTAAGFRVAPAANSNGSSPRLAQILQFTYTSFPTRITFGSFDVNVSAFTAERVFWH